MQPTNRTSWCEWATVKARHGAPVEATKATIVNEILQEAWERGNSAFSLAALSMPEPAHTPERARLQAAFCIDVRSEVFRRALEQIDPGIRTIGFAGFFASSSKHHRFASTWESFACPCFSIRPSPQKRSMPHHPRQTTPRGFSPARSGLGRFKQAAVSSFAFVEASGPTYAAKLVADALALKGTALPNDPKPHFRPTFGA